MARPLRIEFPGALYHVMSRGNERGRIVRDDVDREKRLDWLRRTVETYGWRTNDARRAVTAYLARRRFGHPAGEVAKALGYRSGSSVTRAVARVESGTEQLRRTAAKLEGRLH